MYCRDPQQISHTSTRDLIEKYNLGQPIAENFYLAQYEEHVEDSSSART